MMMDPSMMVGGFGSGMMFFGWILTILLTILAILGIIALLKYINQK